MNDDSAFDRVKVRKARAALAEAGLTAASASLPRLSTWPGRARAWR